MKVLITSGGTKVKIDMVRSITNMSKGTFGSKIADSFAATCRSRNTKCDIKFLMAKDSRYPSNPWTTFIEYVTFDDYKKQLFNIIDNEKPDIIVLAAAVSDYGVSNYVDGKIRSKKSLVIKLTPLPKLISMVRKHAPNATICGFKLLVNSTKEELIMAAKESLIKNKLDLVVGNDLRDIKNDNHILTIVERLLTFDEVKKDVQCVVSEHRKDLGANLPDIVAETCLDHYNYRNQLCNKK